MGEDVDHLVAHFQAIDHIARVQRQRHQPRPFQAARGHHANGVGFVARRLFGASGDKTDHGQRHDMKVFDQREGRLGLYNHGCSCLKAPGFRHGGTGKQR